MSDISKEFTKSPTWNSRLESFFKATGEKCHCYSYLHKQSENHFNKRSTLIDIPVIVLSTITGTLSIGSSSLVDQEHEQLLSIIIGCMSLSVSVLNTVGTYFAWTTRQESHRVTAIQYDKLYRFIAVELALPRNERMAPKALLKMTRDSYDRLSEISPIIPDSIVSSFRKIYKDKHNIAQPDEANDIHPISIYEGASPPNSYLQFDVNTKGRDEEFKEVCDDDKNEH